MVAVREDLCASVVKFAKNKGNHTEIVPPRAENFLCASLALHALAGI